MKGKNCWWVKAASEALSGIGHSMLGGTIVSFYFNQLILEKSVNIIFYLLLISLSTLFIIGGISALNKYEKS